MHLTSSIFLTIPPGFELGAHQSHGAFRGFRVPLRIFASVILDNDVYVIEYVVSISHSENVLQSKCQIK